jgi:hypothetical protein
VASAALSGATAALSRAATGLGGAPRTNRSPSAVNVRVVVVLREMERESMVRAAVLLLRRCRVALALPSQLLLSLRLEPKVLIERRRQSCKLPAIGFGSRTTHKFGFSEDGIARIENFLTCARAYLTVKHLVLLVVIVEQIAHPLHGGASHFL